MKITKIFLLAMVMTVLTALPAAAQLKYKITDLGMLPGGVWSVAHSINNSGQIVGETVFREDSERRRAATLFDPTGGGNNIDLGTLAGYSCSCAFSINDSAQIVGSSYDGDDPWECERSRATLFDPTGGGNNTDLGTLGGDSSSIALSINESSQIVGCTWWGGWSPWECELSRATLFDSTGGGNINLGTLPGGDYSIARSINNSAQIVGEAQPAPGYREHVTLFDATGGGSNIDLGVGWAYSINDYGRIVGCDGIHATVFDSSGAGNNTDLGTLGSCSSEARWISNTGLIVGFAEDAYYRYQATLFDSTGKGYNIDLNDSIDLPIGFRWQLTWMRSISINDQGWIVGGASTNRGESRAFLLTPVQGPQPPGDTTPPTIDSISASPDVLWPANHNMVEVTVTVEAEDDSGQVPTSRIVEVTCNEPVNGPGDGGADSDWQITGDLTVLLRAESAGVGTGRVYTIWVECADASDNIAAATVDVTVPHDQGK